MKAATAAYDPLDAGTSRPEPPDTRFRAAGSPLWCTDCTARIRRELASLDAALDRATRLREAGEPLYVLWHYPPFDQHRRPGPCVSRLEAAGGVSCVYGHLHIEGQWSHAVQGELGGVRYHCVAADAIGFRPLRISRA